MEDAAYAQACEQRRHYPVAVIGFAPDRGLALLDSGYKVYGRDAWPATAYRPLSWVRNVTSSASGNGLLIK